MASQNAEANSGGDGAAAGVNPDNGWIADIVNGILPMLQAPENPTQMDEGNQGGSSSQQPNQPNAQPEGSQLPPQLVVKAARRARKKGKDNEDNRRAEKIVRVIAGKAVLAEHCDKFSRGIQATAAIKTQLNQLRELLHERPTAEVDFMVSQAKREIRQRITMPPFTPAVCKGEHKGQSVSSNTQADVKRALALAEISRLNFDWDVKYGGNSPWNSTVIKVLGSKAVDWLQRLGPVSRKEAGQAPAVIQQWVNTKCWEIQEAASLAGENYDQIKVAKAAKAQFERWRKKIKENRCLMVAQVFKDNIALAHIVENKDCGSNIEDGGENNLPVTRCPHWRSPHLTSILHCLNKMVQTKAIHHQTITKNQQLYGRFQKLFVTGRGSRVFHGTCPSIVTMRPGGEGCPLMTRKLSRRLNLSISPRLPKNWKYIAMGRI
ncbi:hypothetical protein PCANC_23954 [Puccinia coronata f. sp. avenae]|uniref:Uncharacterized protein n=1 Tax=Puccinia coronata f. sp. avenae TaxID=200324 RepID=A0A2N5S3X2_9BASI|nr:hypothetical protein PCANC_23954 [Puccinia coronata f. sp. avenae]